MKKKENSLSYLSKSEQHTLRQLNTPLKIQRYISSLSYNFEQEGETLMSVRETLKERRAHCIEAALVAACALWLNGHQPLLLDMRAENDTDHVVALYKINGYWGAISKSNHAVVRFRDPIYRTLRELAMSYMHEYFNSQGKKTLRAYSRPYNLSSLPHQMWLTGGKSCWEVGALLDDLKHYPLVTHAQTKHLSTLDEMERRVAKVVEYHVPRVTE